MYGLYIFIYLFCMTTYANGHGFKLSPPDQMKFQCFEKDDVPVDIDEVFEGGHCADKNGELYRIGNEEVSCCQCIRYECQQFGELMGETLLFWNTTVSESCCLTCNGTVVPENTKIDTELLDDDCKTIKTSFCRTFPSSNVAAIEYDFNYKNCCNDNSGYLHYINASVLEPSTCSERKCFFSEMLPHTVWKSNQIISGCDCCEVNGKLVPDGHTWDFNGDFYECCHGEIVKKMEGEHLITTEVSEVEEKSSSSSSFVPAFDLSRSSIMDCKNLWVYGWKSNGANIFYKYFEDSFNHHGWRGLYQKAANHLCRSRWNGTLASIHDQTPKPGYGHLNSFLAEEIAGGKPAWIGGHTSYSRLNETWVRVFQWYDGSAWDYTNWSPNAYTNYVNHWSSVVYINYEKTGLWNAVNRHTNSITGYICQKTC